MSCIDDEVLAVDFICGCTARFTPQGHCIIGGVALCTYHEKSHPQSIEELIAAGVTLARIEVLSPDSPEIN